MLPQSAILISQEWLTTIARWTFVSGPRLHGKGECENKVYTARGGAHVLEVKNGLPYLSKELFWQAMEDILTNAKLISGRSWTELEDMIEAQDVRPQIYSVEEVKVSAAPVVEFSRLIPTEEDEEACHYPIWAAPSKSEWFCPKLFH